MDDYERGLEAAAEWLGEWLNLVLAAEWPGVAISYAGAAANGSRHWQIAAGGAVRWFAVTEPALMEPMVRQIPQQLENVDWNRVVKLTEPEGILVSAGGRLFAWDREKDRGVRLIDLD